jgi:hypothetical protein
MFYTLGPKLSEFFTKVGKVRRNSTYMNGCSYSGAGLHTEKFASFLSCFLAVFLSFSPWDKGGSPRHAGVIAEAERGFAVPLADGGELFFWVVGRR